MKEDNRFSIDRQFDTKLMEYYSLLKGFVQESEIDYWIGNPSVEIVNGTIKLKSLNKPSEHCDSSEKYYQALRGVNQKEEEVEVAGVENRCYLLLNGVPNSKGPSQLLYDSPLSQYQSFISEVRVIRTNQLRYYAVLLLFTSQKQGRQCLQDLLGRQYNEVQIQRIVLRQIVEVTLTINQPKRGPPGELLRKKNSQDHSQKLSPDHIFLKTGQKHTVGIKNQSKHPCTICLQQLGGQIISILCGHYFHRHCLQGWEFNTCPLCRYYQQPPVVSFCEQCNQSDGLWICLLCGRRLCCGTVNDIMSQDSHIYQHCKQTGHALSMQIQTKFLFDARVPAFLHQMFYRDLIQKGGEEYTQDKQESKKSKLSQRISNYQKEVAEEMLKQRHYFQIHIAKIIKKHREELNSRKERVTLKKNMLEKLKEEEDVLMIENDIVGQQIEKSQKQGVIINKLLKMKIQKAEVHKNQSNKCSQLEKKRLIQLEVQIEQKKQELINFKNNITLQHQLKTKLKGEKVGEDILFVNEKNKKKKK